MSLILREHMYSWHSLCVSEVDPILMSLIQREHTCLHCTAYMLVGQDPPHQHTNCAVNTCALSE